MENDIIQVKEGIPYLIPNTESIEVTKNSRGYNWTIKINEINIDRMIELNNRMRENFEFKVET